MAVTQADFTTALLDPDKPRPQGLVDPSGRPAGKRFDVYRNNVVSSLIGAMETAFPTIRRLVGDTFFGAMAGVYSRLETARFSRSFGNDQAMERSGRRRIENSNANELSDDV